VIGLNGTKPKSCEDEIKDAFEGLLKLAPHLRTDRIVIETALADAYLKGMTNMARHSADLMKSVSATMAGLHGGK
jgi:hypothetical protein